MHIKNTLIAAAAVSLLGLSAHADAPFAYDSFEYFSAPDMHGANGGAGWSTAWAQVQQIPTGIAGSGLSYPNLQTAGGCAITAGYPSAAFTIYTRVLSAYAAANNTIYVSFLMEPELGFGDGGGLSFTATPQIIVGDALGSPFYGLTQPFITSSVSDVPVVLGETALLVTKVVKNRNGTVTYSLYVNPTVGAPEPAVPDSQLTINGNLPPIASIINDGGYATDEIRFGTTWSSVLPAIAPVCPADFDNDGVVGAPDLGLLLGAWGGPGGDLNGDGITDASDLGIFLGSWGPCD